MAKLNSYSSFEDTRFVIREKGENVTAIVDKVLRKTTQITEIFASDILFELRDYNNAVENKVPYDRLLGFRENGVTAYLPDETDDFSLKLRDLNVLQFWRLSYDPVSEESVFIRLRF